MTLHMPKEVLQDAKSAITLAKAAPKLVQEMMIKQYRTTGPGFDGGKLSFNKHAHTKSLLASKGTVDQDNIRVKTGITNHKLVPN